MALSTGYDTSIRKALTSKGIDNSAIGYNNSSGMVTVNGNDFMKADKNYLGTTYTNQNNFNTAWDNYSKAQQQPQTTGTTGYTQPTTQASTAAVYNPYSQTQTQNPYTAQADKIIQQLLNYGQNQGNFDPYSSSGYRAAEAQAQRAAQANTRAAQEAYGSSGFGRSTALGERVAGMNNDATEYLMTQIVPQLEAQEQSRRQQEYNNIVTALSPLLQQQGRADNLVQQDFNNNLAVADLTGSYKPQGADQIISQLLALKGQAETPGITAEDRNVLNGQANTLRSQLEAMGLDTSALGANVNRANAATANIGTRTLAGQAQDYAQQADVRDYDRGVFESDRAYQFQQAQQEWENNFKSEQFDWQKAQQAWENAFQEKNFQQSMKEAAASRGLQWASLGQRQKEFVAEMAFKEERFKYEKEQDALKLKGTSGSGTGQMSAISNQRPSIQEELSGLDSQLTSMQITPDQALQILAEDYKSGYYTAAEEALLRGAINNYRMKQGSTNVFMR